MAVVCTARMIEDRVETNAMEGRAGLDCRLGLSTDVSEPTAPRIVFGAGLRHDHGAPIAFVNLLQHFTERAIKRMRPLDGRELPDSLNSFEVIKPLIVRI